MVLEDKLPEDYTYDTSLAQRSFEKDHELIAEIRRDHYDSSTLIGPMIVEKEGEKRLAIYDMENLEIIGEETRNGWNIEEPWHEALEP